MSAPRLFGSFFQQSYATTDIEQARAVFGERYGISKFFQMEQELSLQTPEGVKPAQLKIAMAWVDDLQIEIIEPVGGAGAAIYTDVLPADGFGLTFHHMGFLLDGFSEAVWQTFRRQVGNARYPLAFEADMGYCRFAYLDTRATLGHYCEYFMGKRGVFEAVPRC
jgi:hypothetical protein